MKGVPAPRFEEAPVEPVTREEIEALLKACEYCQLAETTDRRRFAMRRPTGKRDRALILTWLDNAHRKLDAAVFAAYGWPPDLSDDDTLCVARLLALNLTRATG